MPCRVCKAIDHPELTCPSPFSSASSEQVLLRQILARNPDYSYAEALRKVQNYGSTGSVKPSTGEEVEERQKDEEPAVEPVGQDLVETSSTPHVSSYDELFPSRRRSAPKAETAPQAQIPETGRHEDIIASPTDATPQCCAVSLDHRVKADEALAQRRTTPTANADDALQLCIASAVKHFRNREEKQETDRVSEAGSYHENEVVDPAVRGGARADIEDGDEEVVGGGDELEENFPGGRENV